MVNPGARDDGDSLLTPPGSLGVLDRAVERAVSLGQDDLTGGSMLVAVGRHPVAALGVSAFDPSLTDEVLAAANAGQSLGAAAAAAAGLTLVIADGGSSSGDLCGADALHANQVDALMTRGRDLGRIHGREGLVALGEIGIGNTTAAAALAGLLLGPGAEQTVGRGSAADAAILDRKRAIVAGALDRVRPTRSARAVDPLGALAQLGGPEFALLAGATLGAVEVGALVVLDGFATSVAALVAARMEPAVAAHLVAGQRSREGGHTLVLAALGLEPLLDLRIRAGEGVGASLAAGLLFDALMIRRSAARTGRAQRKSPAAQPSSPRRIRKM